MCSLAPSPFRKDEKLDMMLEVLTFRVCLPQYVRATSDFIVLYLSTFRWYQYVIQNYL